MEWDKKYAFFDKFTESGIKVIILAQQEARDFRRKAVEPEHLLLGIIGEKRSDASQVLQSAGLSLKASRHILKKYAPEKDEYTFFERIFPWNVLIPFTEESKSALKGSWRFAQDLDSRVIRPKQILLALLESKHEKISELLEKQGVNVAEIKSSLLKRAN